MRDLNQLSVLIVDDEKQFGNLMKMILEKRGYKTFFKENVLDAIQVLEAETIDVVLTDLVMEEHDGIYLLNHIKNNYPDIETIMMTAFGSVESAVEAMKLGAFSYFIKSNNPEEILFELDKLKTIKKLSVENQYLKTNFNNKDMMLSSNNRDFNQAIQIAQMASQTDANVLILGESGVGKEIFARFIHEQSTRQSGVFLPVNCYAFSESLLESELYGHEKGSFTGSTSRRIGRFEAANNGTLFLDEIGDLPESTQVKILRNIETKEFSRIGSNDSIKTDFRLISATNKDLKQAILDREFREDLYYRINTIIIQVPPLRERKEDIPILLEFFLNKASLDMKKPILTITDSMMNQLMTYDYPGNVRELKNIAERLVALSSGTTFQFDINMLFNRTTDKCEMRSLKSVRQDAEKSHIMAILNEVDNDINKASLILEISSRQLYNKINDYGIEL